MADDPSDLEGASSARRDRWTIVLASLIALIQLMALPVVVGLADEPDTTEPDQADEPDPEPEIPSQRFSGDESGHTDTFPIEGGLTVFEVQYDGGGNFIVVLEDEDHERVTGLVNTIGSFTGSTATNLEEGEYVLSVRGRGWTITVNQPRYESADELPVSFSGSGPMATDPFEIAAPEPDPEATPEPDPDGDDDADDNDGDDADNGDNEGGDDGEGDGEGGDDGGGDEDPDDDVEPRPEPQSVRFVIRHEGDGNIRVTLLDRDGNRAAGVLNDRDTVDTVEEIQVDPGVYLLDVAAEGEWHIDVE